MENVLSSATVPLCRWHSTETVYAGEITAVLPGGCMVRCCDSVARFVPFTATMVESGRTGRIEVGDFWLVYDDGYQTTSKGFAFQLNYQVNS